MASFTLAVDRSFVNQQGERETDFIRVVVWRKLAEICANNLTKGRLVAVDGRLQVRSYEDQQGQRRQATEVVGDNVHFLDRIRPQESRSYEAETEIFGEGLREEFFEDKGEREEPPF